MIGTTLSNFKINFKLGEGGMGEVWRAEDTKLGRQVALKLLPGDFEADPDRHARFEREARLLASLNHPNIATLYGLEHLDGRHALIMELVEGDDLSERIASGPLPAAEAIQIGLQIAEALEAAHEQGIVHRDLKPANIKVCADGSVKVLDFGLAKAWETKEDEHSLSLSPTLTRHATAAGVILGTAAYMSPEQARGQAVDRRSDIWAFGVVLWEMLTGSKTYEGETITDIIAAVITREPSWEDLPNTTPRRLSTLLRRCLDKDPRQRLQAIGEARIELAAMVSGVETEESSAATASSPPKSGRLWQSAALILLLTSLFAGWFAVRSPKAPRQVVKASLNLPEGVSFSLDQASPGPVAVSPDGRYLVFSVIDESGATLLWIRGVGDAQSRPLAGTNGARYPFWSPDSRQVGFFSGDGQLRKVDAVGGPPVTICEAANGKGGSWNDDGRILFAPAHDSGIQMVSSGGGEITTLTELAEGVSSHRFPTWLPDGRFLFVARSTAGVQEDRIRLASPRLPGSSEDPGSSEELLRASSNVVVTANHLLFLREGTLMAQPFDAQKTKLIGDPVAVVDDVLFLAGARCGVFSASKNGLLIYMEGYVQRHSELVWMDRDGREESHLGGGIYHRDLTLSRDGRFVAVAIIDEVAGSSDLWIYNVNRGLKTRFTFDPAMDWFPVWSPDGSSIAFASNSTRDMSIFRKSTGGSTAREPVFEIEGTNVAPEAWTPDGQTIVFVRADRGGSFDIWSLPLAGGEPVPLVATSFNEEMPALSPDGRWLAYVSVESGRREVYVTTFPEPARRWQVSTGGGTCPRWSHQGDEIYVLTLDGTLLAFEIDVSDEGFTVGKAQQLFSWNSPQVLGHPYDVAPDGRFLVNRSSGLSESFPLNLVLNWEADLRE